MLNKISNGVYLFLCLFKNRGSASRDRQAGKNSFPLTLKPLSFLPVCFGEPGKIPREARKELKRNIFRI